LRRSDYDGLLEPSDRARAVGAIESLMSQIALLDFQAARY